MMHLTFDDGPSSEWTPQILDLLANHDVQATFFVIGCHIKGRDKILTRACADGHTIGVHAWAHPRLTDLTDDQVDYELHRTREQIYLWTGWAPRVWRAPYYAADARVLRIARSLGLEHVGADVVPDDWMLNDAAVIAERVLEATRNRVDVANVTLHDGIPPGGGSASCTQSRQPTVDALRIILETLA